MTTPSLPRHWRFAREDDSSRVFTVHALTPLEANESDHNLKAQVEQLLSHVYATATGSSAKAVGAVANLFALASSSSAEKDERTERKLLLFVYSSSDDKSDEELLVNSSKILGFARVYDDFETNAVVVSSFALLPGIPEAHKHEVIRTLFHATQEVGEAFAQSMLLAQNQTQHSTSDAIPLWRGLFGASEYLKQFIRDQGFSGERFDRLELTKFLKNVDQLTASETEAVTLFPNGITVKPLDLEQDDLVKVYDVLKMAFGGNPPSFEAWKAHYAQQPRFAPELSFVAWATDESGDKEQEPVSVLLIERIVDGEGGGDDEVDRVYATHGELQKAAKLGEYDEKPDQTLAFPADFDARKSAIEATARAAYVCGVATKIGHRGQGIASNLLKLSFEQAEKTTILEKATLGTDRFNTSAVRAYLRAGMVETASVNLGRLVSKDIQRSGP